MPTSIPLHPTGQVLTVPTSWADVTLAQYVALFAPVADEARTAAELLLHLPAGGLNQLAVEDVQYIANLIAFANDPGPVLELLPTPKLPEVGALPYGTLLMAQQHIQADPERPLLAYGPYLLALYRVQLTYGKYDEAKVAACLAALLAAPVTEAVGDMGHFIGGVQELAERYAPHEADHIEPEDEELDAGSEEIGERFGPLLGLDAAAGGSLLNYEAVLKLDADTVLSKLRMEAARSAYQRRYQKIISNKKD